MPQYKAPVRDISFVLREMFNFGEIRALPGYAEIGDDLIDAVLQEGARFCENELFPLNHTGDEEGCTWNNKEVKTPKGFKEAYTKFAEGGWVSLACDPEYGGQGLPESIEYMLEEMVCASNISFSLYPGLTRGAYSSLHSHASEELKQKYLPKMIEGIWTGTMNLTEPHCGTDLGFPKRMEVTKFLVARSLSLPVSMILLKILSTLFWPEHLMRHLVLRVSACLLCQNSWSRMTDPLERATVFIVQPLNIKWGSKPLQPVPWNMKMPLVGWLESSMKVSPICLQ